MPRATTAAANPSQNVCKCGVDHRDANTRQCSIFNILIHLHNKIQKFLDAQEVFEFGEHGPLAHCLRYTLLEVYDLTNEAIQPWEVMSKDRPEWQLADEISRLRRYFEQVADGCVDADGRVKKWCRKPPHSVIPDFVGEKDSLLGRANVSVNNFYETCHDVINKFVHNGAESLSLEHDDGGYLPMVDNAYKETFENMLLLPKTENATIQDLTKRSYDIWRECRRLLCDFKRLDRKIYLI